MWSWKKKIKKKDKIEIESLTPDRYIDLAKTNRNKQKIIYALTLIIIFLIIFLHKFLLFFLAFTMPLRFL